MSKNKWGSVLVAVLGLFVLSACASPPSRFYMLAPKTASGPSVEALGSIAVGVGPIRFPEYLDRPQFVTRQGESGLEIEEFDRWAEPLSRNFSEVLTSNIAAYTGSDQVFDFPWTGKVEIDYRVLAGVTRFDVDAEGQAVLEVQWRVIGPDDTVLVPEARSRYTAASTPGDHANAVQALNSTVAEFAADITSALAGLAG